jgi:ankyrin repeat protein
MLSRLLLLFKIASKHHSIFQILYNDAAQCDPHTAGDLLCTATKIDDITMTKELLKQGVDVDSKDRHRLIVIQIAMAKNNVDMVNLLVGNGVNIVNAKF